MPQEENGSQMAPPKIAELTVASIVECIEEEILDVVGDFLVFQYHMEIDAEMPIHKYHLFFHPKIDSPCGKRTFYDTL